MCELMFLDEAAYCSHWAIGNQHLRKHFIKNQIANPNP